MSDEKLIPYGEGYPELQSGFQPHYQAVTQALEHWESIKSQYTEAELESIAVDHLPHVKQMLKQLEITRKEAKHDALKYGQMVDKVAKEIKKPAELLKEELEFHAKAEERRMKEEEMRIRQERLDELDQLGIPHSKYPNPQQHSPEQWGRYMYEEEQRIEAEEKNKALEAKIAELEAREKERQQEAQRQREEAEQMRAESKRKEAQHREEMAREEEARKEINKRFADTVSSKLNAMFEDTLSTAQEEAKEELSQYDKKRSIYHNLLEALATASAGLREIGEDPQEVERLNKMHIYFNTKLV